MRTPLLHAPTLFLTASFALTACGSSSDTDPPDLPAPMSCSPTFCEDAIILDMSLHADKTSAGTVTNTNDGGDWVSVMDATAGGTANAADNAFLYMKFTADGLVKVDIDDETALGSTDWDIAARRYLIRLNGGTSGAGCVAAAKLDTQAYADLTEVPGNLTFSYDQSYDDSCTIIDDGSGLPGSPDVALNGWWSYPGCVATTHIPFLIKLADGTHIKLVMEQYYATGQEACNENGTSGGTSAMLTARWSYL